MILGALAAAALLSPAASGVKLAGYALEQTAVTRTYDPSYVRLKYPGGDVHPSKGVCTDVVIRALRPLGHDLQKLIHLDIKANPRRYPRVKRADTNIDHRRCSNQIPFFRHHGREHGIKPEQPDKWLPGDIVFWKLPSGLDHVGILSSNRNAKGWPLVVHNLGYGTNEEDVLWNWKMVARFRYPVK